MRAFAALLWLLGAASVRAEGLQVAPTGIAMTPAHPISSFTLRNDRDRDASFEATAYAWTQQDGRDVLTPTREIALTPSVFLIPARSAQIVRLGLVAHPSGAEQAYRIVVRELPPADPAPLPRNGFRILIEMSLPAFVTPPNAHGVLSARRVDGDDGAPELMLSNTGDAHLSLSAGPGGGVDVPHYLLAGASAERPIAPNLDRVELYAASAGDAEPHQQSFELGHATAVAGLR